MMNRKFQKGFTIIELMVSIGILVVLFALTTINLSRLPSATSQSSSYDLLVSDLRSQQTKAMARGDSYGIHFDNPAADGTYSYTLFKGANYLGGTDYFTVKLDPGLSFALPIAVNNSIVFASGSGDIVNIGSITINNSFINETKIINLNKYGATTN